MMRLGVWFSVVLCWWVGAWGALSWGEELPKKSTKTAVNVGVWPFVWRASRVRKCETQTRRGRSLGKRRKGNGFHRVVRLGSFSNRRIGVHDSGAKSFRLVARLGSFSKGYGLSRCPVGASFCDRWKACWNGATETCRELAVELLERKKAEEQGWGRMLMRAACWQGNGKSCRQLGVLYDRGIGVPVFPRIARRWYQEACRRGDAIGCYNLGAILSVGWKVTQNDRQARRLFKKACEKQLAQACSALGELWEQGRGGPRHYKKAMVLFQEGCQRGDGKGCLALANMYRGRGRLPDDQGRRIATNPDQAQVWLEKGCALKNRGACIGAFSLVQTTVPFMATTIAAPVVGLLVAPLAVWLGQQSGAAWGSALGVGALSAMLSSFSSVMWFAPHYTGAGIVGAVFVVATPILGVLLWTQSQDPVWKYAGLGLLVSAPVHFVWNMVGWMNVWTYRQRLRGFRGQEKKSGVPRNTAPPALEQQKHLWFSSPL